MNYKVIEHYKNANEENIKLSIQIIINNLIMAEKKSQS